MSPCKFGDNGWTTEYEDGVPVRLVWRELPDQGHRWERLLHGYRRCLGCGLLDQEQVMR